MQGSNLKIKEKKKIHAFASKDISHLAATLSLQNPICYYDKSFTAAFPRTTGTLKETHQSQRMSAYKLIGSSRSGCVPNWLDRILEGTWVGCNSCLHSPCNRGGYKRRRKNEELLISESATPWKQLLNDQTQFKASPFNGLKLLRLFVDQLNCSFEMSALFFSHPI